MDDVIFMGTANRPPRRAEVALTLDNTRANYDRRAEVTISRTLFRSATPSTPSTDDCRLLDVQELLSDSGSGANST